MSRRTGIACLLLAACAGDPTGPAIEEPTPTFRASATSVWAGGSLTVTSAAFEDAAATPAFRFGDTPLPTPAPVDIDRSTRRPRTGPDRPYIWRLHRP